MAETPEARRAAYLKHVLGDPAPSLLVDDPAQQKKKFEGEAERLAGLVAEVGSSAKVTGDCAALLGEAITLINATTPDKSAIIAKLDAVKQRLVRAYDSRQVLSGWFAFVAIYNLLVLAVYVYLIVWLRLIPGQPRLEDTAFVILACAVWGGVGSIVDAFVALYTHLANQDFDKQYWPWYWAHPLLGASLGAIVYLVLQAGLLATTGTPLQEGVSANVTAVSANATALAAPAAGRAGVTALPIVFAILAGFRQQTIIRFLVRLISTVFQSNGSQT